MPDPDISLGYWAAIVAQQYYTLMLHRLQKYDLDRGFYAMLMIADAEGKLSQQQLAQTMKIEKVTMLRIIDLLSAKGYVERFDDPGDRRKHLIRLLPKGRPVVKDIRKAYQELNDLAFTGLNPSQRKVFIEQLNGILDRLSLGDLRPVPLKYNKKIPK